MRIFLAATGVLALVLVTLGSGLLSVKASEFKARPINAPPADGPAAPPPPPAKTAPEAPKAGSEPPTKSAADASEVGLMKQTFSPPAPSKPADDPRLVQAKASSEAIHAALSRVRERVSALRAKLELKGTENDMKAVVNELKEMTLAARGDCDAVLRAAEDVRGELRFAREAYEDAAHSYRLRARTYREKHYREAEDATAEQLELLAADTPRRIRLTDRFIDSVSAAREFLAETSRFLSSAETAVVILSVAPDAVRPSPKAERIRSYLGGFLDLVERFQSDLLQSPWTKAKDSDSQKAPQETIRPKIEERPAAKAPEPASEPKGVPPEKLGPAPKEVPPPARPSSEQSSHAVPPKIQTDRLDREVASPAKTASSDSRHAEPLPTRPAATVRLVYCTKCRAYHRVPERVASPYNPAFTRG